MYLCDNVLILILIAIIFFFFLLLLLILLRCFVVVVVVEHLYLDGSGDKDTCTQPWVGMKPWLNKRRERVA